MPTAMAERKERAMETTTVDAETRQETEIARRDLLELLEEIRRARGYYSTENAAKRLLLATEQGRVVGSSYGYYNEEDGKIYACILGHLDISLDGLARLGNVPQWECYQQQRAGGEIESYANTLSCGSTPENNDHSRNLAAWLREFISS